MFPQLPTELSIDILKQLDRKTLSSVLRVSASFREIGEPLLYHAIVLAPFTSQASTEHATTCLRTIAKRESLLLAVRQLELYVGNEYSLDRGAQSEGAVDEFFDILQVALPKLSRVVKLNMSRASLLPPTGRKLPCNAPLQSLQHYLGPPEILEGIEKLPLLSVGIFSRRSGSGAFRYALLRISQSCRTTLRVLKLHQVGDIDPLGSINPIAEIPNLFPNLVTLVLNDVRYLGDERIDAICKIMANLKRLRLFQGSDHWFLSMEEEERVVKRLHMGCPQLRAISIAKWCFSEKLQRWLCDPAYAPLERNPLALDPEGWLEAHYEQHLADPVHEGFDWKFTSWRA